MRLLVVEDDPRLARLIARGLREEAYAVDVCENGSDAIVQAVVNTYDAIILDVMLPGVDGFGVVAALRARHVRTPVLMLTSRDAVADRIAGLDHGADDYLTKPFDFGELLARLRALLRRPEALQTMLVRVSRLRSRPRSMRSSNCWRAASAPSCPVPTSWRMCGMTITIHSPTPSKCT